MAGPSRADLIEDVEVLIDKCASLQEHLAQAEAREKATERVVRAARQVAKTYPWHPGRSDARRENFYAIEELQVSLGDLDAALAPPGTPEGRESHP